MTTVSVVIPTIPGREEMLDRALASVAAQKRQPDAVIVEPDPERTGAAATRNRALARVETDFVAWLDDDDEFLPNHVRGLMLTQKRTGADLVYSLWSGINTRLFHIEIDGVRVSPFALPWGEYHEKMMRSQNFLPITNLVRTSMMRDAGGFRQAHEGVTAGEDFFMWNDMLDLGARFFCHSAVTWRWNGHAGHTSGRGK